MWIDQGAGPIHSCWVKERLPFPFSGTTRARVPVMSSRSFGATTGGVCILHTRILFNKVRPRVSSTKTRCVVTTRAWAPPISIEHITVLTQAPPHGQAWPDHTSVKKNTCPKKNHPKNHAPIVCLRPTDAYSARCWENLPPSSWRSWDLYLAPNSVRIHRPKDGPKDRDPSDRKRGESGWLVGIRGVVDHASWKSRSWKSQGKRTHTHTHTRLYLYNLI